MATARCVAYMAHMLGMQREEEKGMSVANKLRERIATLYLQNGKDNWDWPQGSASMTPGPEMGLFSRTVPGIKRCIVLKNWFKRSGSVWSGDEERLFVEHLKNVTLVQEMISTGELTKYDDKIRFGYSQWQGFNEGIFSIRYSLKTLSEMVSSNHMCAII
jgi:hypothetical protein